MNTIIQDQLDRIESALTNLNDSIASYNPSLPAANNLLAADDQLQKGLKQLTLHQRNHARILELHDKITHQNAQITTTIRSLADARVDLLSTSTSLPAEESRSVPYAELLEYAKRISRNTRPPTFRSTFFLMLTQAPTSTLSAVNGNTEPPVEPEDQGKGKGTEALEDAERQWLEPLTNIPFVPWVTDDKIKMGALTQIQAMVERGEDPAKMGVDEVQGGGQIGDDMEDVQGEGAAQAGTRGEGHVKKQEPQAVFGGLDLFDPDELQ